MPFATRRYIAIWRTINNYRDSFDSFPSPFASRETFPTHETRENVKQSKHYFIVRGINNIDTSPFILTKKKYPLSRITISWDYSPYVVHLLDGQISASHCPRNSTEESLVTRSIWRSCLFGHWSPFLTGEYTNQYTAPNVTKYFLKNYCK